MGAADGTPADCFWIYNPHCSARVGRCLCQRALSRYNDIPSWRRTVSVVMVGVGAFGSAPAPGVLLLLALAEDSTAVGFIFAGTIVTGRAGRPIPEDFGRLDEALESGRTGTAVVNGWLLLPPDLVATLRSGLPPVGAVAALQANSAGVSGFMTVI